MQGGILGRMPRPQALVVLRSPAIRQALAPPPTNSCAPSQRGGGRSRQYRPAIPPPPTPDAPPRNPPALPLAYRGWQAARRPQQPMPRASQNPPSAEPHADAPRSRHTMPDRAQSRGRAGRRPRPRWQRSPRGNAAPRGRPLSSQRRTPALPRSPRPARTAAPVRQAKPDPRRRPKHAAFPPAPHPARPRQPASTRPPAHIQRSLPSPDACHKPKVPSLQPRRAFELAQLGHVERIDQRVHPDFISDIPPPHHIADLHHVTDLIRIAFAEELQERPRPLKHDLAFAGVQFPPQFQAGFSPPPRPGDRHRRIPRLAHLDRLIVHHQHRLLDPVMRRSGSPSPQAPPSGCAPERTHPVSPPPAETAARIATTACRPAGYPRAKSSRLRPYWHARPDWR